MDYTKLTSKDLELIRKSWSLVKETQYGEFQENSTMVEDGDGGSYESYSYAYATKDELYRNPADGTTVLINVSLNSYDEFDYVQYGKVVETKEKTVTQYKKVPTIIHAGDIVNAFIGQGISPEDVWYGDKDSTLEGIGDYKYIKDETSPLSKIIHFPKYDIYLKINSYASSYGGNEFDEWSEVTAVRPETKTITIYK
jgi:hypothetical protein